MENRAESGYVRAVEEAIDRPTEPAPMTNDDAGAAAALLPYAQREAREELGTKSQGIIENLAAVSHELRNSVGVIRNATRIIETSPCDPRVVIKARQLIERQIVQMERLIGDLLEVSRVNGDARCLRRERVDLRVLAGDAIESVKPEIDRRRQQLTVVLPETPVWLHADAGRLGQVLLNLLGNAVKYTDTGGEVRLCVEREQEVATVCVKDSGIGIAPALLPHVFEPFMQARSALPRSEMGLGIGLALVTNIVALHGGRVTAASAGLGRGSEFTVYLPVTAT